MWAVWPCFSQASVGPTLRRDDRAVSRAIAFPSAHEARPSLVHHIQCFGAGLRRVRMGLGRRVAETVGGRLWCEVNWGHARCGRSFGSSLRIRDGEEPVLPHRRVDLAQEDVGELDRHVLDGEADTLPQRCYTLPDRCLAARLMPGKTVLPRHLAALKHQSAPRYRRRRLMLSRVVFNLDGIHRFRRRSRRLMSSEAPGAAPTTRASPRLAYSLVPPRPRYAVRAVMQYTSPLPQQSQTSHIGLPCKQPQSPGMSRIPMEAGGM